MTGESSSAPKIHNTVERMGVARAYAANKACAGEAMAAHVVERNDTLIKVNTNLKDAGVYTSLDIMDGKTPTVKDLDQYVKAGGDVRVLAYRTYRNVHGLQGHTSKYNYLFDFVHGGGENHPTVVHKRPYKPVIDNKSKVAKAPKKPTPAQSMEVSTIVGV